MKVCARTSLLVAALRLWFSNPAAAQNQPIPKGTGVPVVLINGSQALCSVANTSNSINDATVYFGALPAFLGNTGHSVLFFNTCQYPDVPIYSIAANFGSFLAPLKYDDGSAVTQVDIVAFSLGGLVAR